MYIDNYVATHGRVSSEWRPRWSRRTARGNSSTRAAGAGSRAAETRAQGHLTTWEPKRKPGAASAGRGAFGPGGRPHGPLGLRPRAPPGSVGSPCASSPVSPRSSLASASPPPPPSPPLRRRLRLVPGRGRVLPLLSPGMVSSRSFVSPSPPLFSPKRRSRLLSSPLKPTWRRQLPERAQVGDTGRARPLLAAAATAPASPPHCSDTQCVTTETTLEHDGKCSRGGGGGGLTRPSWTP